MAGEVMAIRNPPSPQPSPRPTGAREKSLCRSINRPRYQRGSNAPRAEIVNKCLTPACW